MESKGEIVFNQVTPFAPIKPKKDRKKLDLNIRSPEEKSVKQHLKDDYQQKTNQNDKDKVGEAIDDFTKEFYKQEIESQEKFDSLVNSANRVIYHLETVFPFKFFPTKISIGLKTIDVVREYFFESEKIQAILIQDVADVIVTTDLLFASIKIVDKNFAENSVEVAFLKKGEAIKARKIIQGMIVAKSEKIDLTKIEPSKLVIKLEELGDTKTRVSTTIEK